MQIKITCAECYELDVVTGALVEVFAGVPDVWLAGVLAGALLAGVPIGVAPDSEGLDAAVLGADSPLLVDSLPLDAAVVVGALGDKDLERLSVL